MSAGTTPGASAAAAGASASAPPDLLRATLDRAAGYRLLGELAGPATVEGTLNGLDALAPGFPDWIVTALFGGTYQREGLALRDRQIATLAALTALGGVEPQLDDHVRNSVRIGLEPREITEVMVHLAPYVGVPKALAGLRVAAAVLRDLDPAPEAEPGQEPEAGSEAEAGSESGPGRRPAAGPAASAGAGGAA